MYKGSNFPISFKPCYYIFLTLAILVSVKWYLYGKTLLIFHEAMCLIKDYISQIAFLHLVVTGKLYGNEFGRALRKALKKTGQAREKVTGAFPFILPFFCLNWWLCSRHLGQSLIPETRSHGFQHFKMSVEQRLQSCVSEFSLTQMGMTHSPLSFWRETKPLTILISIPTSQKWYPHFWKMYRQIDGVGEAQNVVECCRAMEKSST